MPNRRQMAVRRTRLVVVALAALAATACGSTVAPGGLQEQMNQADGLGPAEGPGDATAGEGMTTDGTSAAPDGSASGDGSGSTPGGATTLAPNSAGTTNPHAAKSGGAAPPSAAGQGPTGPIEVGFVLTEYSNAEQFGLDSDSTVTEKKIIDALVQSFNEAGGIAGRRVVPIYAATDTGSASIESDFAAACARFTQDHRVVAVLGRIVAWSDSFENCLNKAGVPHIMTAFTVPDIEAFRRFPLLVAPSNATLEKRSALKIDGALNDGLISSASKLGILMDECAPTQRAWRSVRQYIEAKQLNIAKTATVRCPSGSSDSSGILSDLQNAVLQFKAAGADNVLFISMAEASTMYFFTQAAEPQGYRPRYVVSSIAWLAQYGSQMPAQQRANVHGYGWLPSVDLLPAQWPSLPGPAQRCLTTLKSKGQAPTQAREHFNAFGLCEAFFLYEKALTATGGKTDARPLIAAVEQLGSGYVSSINIEGRSEYGRSRRDAAAAARHFAWGSECNCFAYLGPLRAIG